MTEINFRGLLNPANIIMTDETLSIGDCWIIKFPDYVDKKYMHFKLFDENYIAENYDRLLYKGGHVFTINKPTIEKHIDTTFEKYDKKIEELEKQNKILLDKIENIKKEVSDKIHDILNKNDLIIRLLESHQ